MNWKKLVAKEWLWFICSCLGVFLVWLALHLILQSIYPHHDYVSPELDPAKIFAEDRENYYNYSETINFLSAIAIPLIYLMRITIWALRTIKK